MSKKVIIFLVIGITIGAFMDNLLFKTAKDDISINTPKKENGISMMLETGKETGQYELTTKSTWPTTDYKFNSKLSKCEKGGKVSWDFANKRVKMEGISSDKCYIYFDKIVTVDSYCTSGDNLSSCIKSFGNQGYDVSSIYIHNSNLENGAGDNSYRFAGASEHVNNFVCFGSDASTCPTDNLYRIIGVFEDQVKLIKYDYATSTLLGTDGNYFTNLDVAVTNYSYISKFYIGNKNLSDIALYCWNRAGKNIWSTSLLNTTNLNTNYLSSLDIKWSNMIGISEWKVGGNTIEKIALSTPSIAYQNEIVSPAESTTYSAKIGLMYVSDYGYAASSIGWKYALFRNNDVKDYYSITNENWMYMGIEEWTITRRTDSTNIIFDLSPYGNIYNTHTPYNNYAIRPCFYLNSTVTFQSGEGTKDNPIRLNLN